MKISTCNLILGICLAFCAGAITSSDALGSTIFKTTDEKGNVSFSDESGPQSKKIELGPVNTQPFPQGSPPAPRKKTATKPKYDSIAVVSPQHETTIPSGVRSVSVSVVTSPVLHPKHVIQLMLNGKSSGKATHALNFTLDNLHRGEHTLQANILDNQGKLIKSSKPIKLYVIRPKI